MTDTDTLAAFLEGRRWFAGDPATAHVVDSTDLGGGLTQRFVVSDDHRYQLVFDDDGTEIDDNPALAQHLLGIVAPTEHAESVRHLGAEQSNTSFVFDERVLLKIFRKVGDRPNPDVEVAQALRTVGFTHVPEILARWQRGGRDFGVLQPFLLGATDGWALALASLRQLFGERTSPEDAGGDFSAESGRLGTMTAEMHIALAAAFGATRGDVVSLAETIANGETAPTLRQLGDAGALVRVHGDYHLGQVLRTDDAWFVVDFEGEPARSEHERLAPNSPLKDVAGMVRSFDYAAAVAVREQGDESTFGLARAWERHNRAAFLDSYWEAMRSSDLLPHSHLDAVHLMEALELEKALYEVDYERAHRPAWVDIPAAAVARMRAA